MVEKYRRAVSGWLFFMAAMVLGMIVLGGLTRLTQSGLSMVEWKPLMGSIPPLSEAEWLSTFEKYKAYPEYQKVNQGMDLDGFKKIFWFEYGHRVLGRLIGMAFAFPALFFGIKGALSPQFTWRFVILFCLGGLQGVVGWWMVKSGLVDRPDVSHYRLTTHLGLAVFLYIALLWTAFEYSRSSIDVSKRQSRYAFMGMGLILMVYLTLLSGGLVAGLNAGHQYNTFPLMGGQWIPDGIMVMKPWYQNLTENLATVQFNHRYLALTTATLIVIFGVKMRQILWHPMQRKARMSMFVMVLLQVTLGISTLLTVVWVPLASLHQMGAVLLLSSLVWMVTELWFPRNIDSENIGNG